MTVPVALRCRCPDPDCTGWLKVPSLGGGHVTRAKAMELLESKPVEIARLRRRVARERDEQAKKTV